MIPGETPEKTILVGPSSEDAFIALRDKIFGAEMFETPGAPLWAKSKRSDSPEVAAMSSPELTESRLP